MSKSLTLILFILFFWFFVIRGATIFDAQTFTRYKSGKGTFTTGQGFQNNSGTFGGGTYGNGGGRVAK